MITYSTHCEYGLKKITRNCKNTTFLRSKQRPNKKGVIDIIITPCTLIFSADARSMFIEIPTVVALRIIGEYLQTHQRSFSNIPIKALTEALIIIMRNNVFVFGDTFGTNKKAPPWEHHQQHYMLHSSLQSKKIHWFPTSNANSPTKSVILTTSMWYGNHNCPLHRP